MTKEMTMAERVQIDADRKRVTAILGPQVGRLTITTTPFALMQALCALAGSVCAETDVDPSELSEFKAAMADVFQQGFEGRRRMYRSGAKLGGSA
jgi:hypothetical protein